MTRSRSLFLSFKTWAIEDNTESDGVVVTTFNSPHEAVAFFCPLITKQMNKHWHGIMYRTTEKCKYLNMSREKKRGSEEN